MAGKLPAGVLSSSWLVAAALISIPTLTSCGGTAAAPTPSPKTPTVAIAADPTTIAQGSFVHSYRQRSGPEVS